MIKHIITSLVYRPFYRLQVTSVETVSPPKDAINTAINQSMLFRLSPKLRDRNIVADVHTVVRELMGSDKVSPATIHKQTL